jgi:RNA polymerase sigma-70 factor (ECF subfamily)
MTEAELVEQLSSGDEDAYRILLDRHLAPITAYVTRMMASNADTEDIVQETFLRLWTHGTRYNPDTAKLTTWLHNIAHNLCIDHFRKHNRMVQEETADEPDEQEAFVDQLTHFENAKHVEQSLMQLPERQRSAIIMCHYQGMSNRDAAVILETSVEALESLMARGRRKLRKLLETKI